MNATGALSNLDEDEEAIDNEGLGTNIHDDEMTASDEEVEDQDQIEIELMYDSDYDKDYVPSFSDSESSDNVEGSEDAEKRLKKKKIKKETTRKTSGPSNDVSLAANSSSAPFHPCSQWSGRRRRQAEVDVPVPPIVSFDTATLDAKHGFRWCTCPQLSTNRAARNIVAVCQWTNKRMEIAASKYKKKTSTHKNVEREELRAFIGVLIFSGCQKDSHMSICDMWSVEIGAPLYRAAMSQARFEFILNCLRFDDPQTREMRRETDRFAPIRELFDKFMEKCERHYTPSENLCVDEQLVGFRGNCSFRMYIPSKPAGMA
ncbi:piggyBac transposable element-derived protein 4-like [Macrobrachium rosenbergii]|uniref:piggyBac transposable element-derived protein 4-like n=1 Tax=Macrobrachium rosenbergii TaxID=79674 RepID=UPI0034D4EB08